MRGIRASALHRAASSPDVDGFTLGARAVERLGPGTLDLSTTGRLILVGDLPPAASDDLPRFLGVAMDPPPNVAWAPTLTEAVGAALASDPPGPALVVAASIPSRPPSVPESGSTESRNLAIALWIDERDPTPESVSPGAVASLTIDQLAHEARRLGAPWAEGAPAGDRVARGEPEAREAPLAADLPVAQGAYVPWPRYTAGTAAHWNLTADRCGTCGVLTFPPRGRCRSCGITGAFARVRLDPDSGRVVASTRIGPGGQPTEFDDQVKEQGPYGVVIVEFEGGVRATLQVADHAGAPLPIGSRVGTELRRSYPMEGRWRYARKAVPRPAGESGGSR
jgi:uncharacterized OB-fold protein